MVLEFVLQSHIYTITEFMWHYTKTFSAFVGGSYMCIWKELHFIIDTEISDYHFVKGNLQVRTNLNNNFNCLHKHFSFFRSNSNVLIILTKFPFILTGTEYEQKSIKKEKIFTSL